MDSSDSKLRDIAAQLDIDTDELEAIKNDKESDLFDLNIIIKLSFIVAVVSAFLGFLSVPFLRPLPQTYPYAPLAVGIIFQKNSLKKIDFFFLVIGINLWVAMISFFFSSFFIKGVAQAWGPQPMYGVFYKIKK